MEVEDAADNTQDLKEKESCTVVGPYLQDGYHLVVGRPTLEGHNHLCLEVDMLQGYRLGVGTNINNIHPEFDAIFNN